MRFKLHHVPNQNPVLAFCNAAGNIFFWDLKRLTAHRDVMSMLANPTDKSKPLQLPSWQKLVIPRAKADPSSKSRATDGEQDLSIPVYTNHAESREFSPETLESWATKYSMDDTHEPLRHHKMESSTANFVGRQASWSPGGEWCVVVGSSNTALLLQRWAPK
jgi:polycomb protein EED